MMVIKIWARAALRKMRLKTKYFLKKNTGRLKFYKIVCLAIVVNTSKYQRE